MPASALTPPPLIGLEVVMGTFISVALAIVGAGVVVMIVIAGFQFLSAGGDKEGAAKARNTLTYAILGLILAVSAWMILALVGKFLGLDLSTFKLSF